MKIWFLGSQIERKFFNSQEKKWKALPVGKVAKTQHAPQTRYPQWRNVAFSMIDLFISFVDYFSRHNYETRNV